MKFSRLTLIFLVICLFGGCNDDNPWATDSGEGKISVNLVTDVSVEDAVPIFRSSEEILQTPDIQDFCISLSKSDGSFSSSWLLSEFPQDRSFATGAYLIEASYGQMDIEGFNAPYFYGSTEFMVKNEETAEPVITASLANCMVSIDYTDDFKNFFPDYSATLHSKGGEYISYEKGETRPAFFCPGNISIAVSLTKQNGISAIFQPADFIAEPKHHYHVTFDVNDGNNGETKLEIHFDSSIATESVEIDLSDEVMLAPAPVVTPIGFTSGVPLSFVEGTRSTSPLKFLIIAKGGISSATLTTNSRMLEDAGFPNEIDLVSPEAAMLSTFGIVGKGLWNNPDKLAELDLTGITQYIIGDGSHSFTLVVKDKLTKVNEPVELVINTTPMNVSIVSTSISLAGEDEGSMVVDYAGTDFVNNISFRVQDVSGNWINSEIISVSQRPGTSYYDVRIKIPATASDVPIKIYYKGQEKDSSTIFRNSPEYSIAVDAFAEFAKVKIIPSDSSQLELITEKCEIYINGTRAIVDSRNVSTGIITVRNLEPETNYSFASAYVDGAKKTAEVNVTTEKEVDIPNGDFESTSNVGESNLKIPSGGVYYETRLSINPYQNTTTFNVSQPKEWASVNDKTFNLSASQQNTWYVIPSTEIVTDVRYSGSSSVRLTNVAFDNNGPKIDPYNFTWGKADPKWGASQNPPGAIAYRAAGKLFLGSYSFVNASTSEVYNEGIPFPSRPQSLSGWYMYDASVDASDKGLVKIEVIGSVNGEETVIASGSTLLEAKSSFSSFSIPLNYSRFWGVKANKVKVMFASSSYAGEISYETSAIKTSNDLVSATSKGNILWLDKIEFNY